MITIEPSDRKYQVSLELLFMHYPDMVAVVSHEGYFIIANTAWSKILGWDAAALTSTGILSFVHTDDQHSIDCFLNSLKGGRSASNFKCRFRCKSGDYKWLSWNTVSFPDEQYSIVAVRDITEEKKSEDHLQQSIASINQTIEGKNKELQQINDKFLMQVDKLHALREIDLAITSSLDIRLNVKVILDEVVNQLKVDAADVLLFKPHSHTLEHIGGRGFKTNALRHTNLHLGQGYAGRAALEKETIRILNLLPEKNNLFLKSPLLKDEGFVSYIGVPLISKGQIKGVLEIFHRSSLNPDQDWDDFLEALATQSAIAIDNAGMFHDLERSNVELSLAYDTTLEGFSRALDYRDNETGGHSQRVARMTVDIAKSVGINNQDIVDIKRGALLHDCGKIQIPDKILLKPGKLTSAERKVIEQHPVVAFEILSPISSLRKGIDIPYCHHEKWDGTGYPRGLKGEQIPLSARIFSVVDVYDALRSNRPYRRAWKNDRTCKYILQHKGVFFDPDIVDIFLKKDWQDTAPSSESSSMRHVDNN